MALPWRTILSYALPPGIAGLGVFSYFLWSGPGARSVDSETSSAYLVPADGVSTEESLVPLPAVGHHDGLSAAEAAGVSALSSSAGIVSVEGEALVPTAAPGVLTLAQAEAALPDLATALSAHPSWGQWLQQGELLQRVIRAVDAISLGEIPLSSCVFLRSQEPFTASVRDGLITQSAASAARYDGVINGFCAIDPAAAAALFRRLEPALQEAVNALGYRERSIRDVLQAAAATLLAVPVPGSDPALVTHDGILYCWADPELEALGDVQKLFLRLGRDNMLKARRQISDLAEAAGIDVSE